jgi:hypothetical protein
MELTYSTWSNTRWYHVSTELHENPITLAEIFSVARCTIPQAHPTKENKLKIITKYWRHRKHNFLYEVMNADICDTCEDKRNLCTEFEPENIVITSVTNSSLGCDCLHRAQFLTFYRLEMVPAFISGRHVRVTPKRTREWMRRETLPKRSWILKSMESEIGRHKVLRNASIWRQSRCAKTMDIHNWENRQNTYQSALLQACTNNTGTDLSLKTRSAYATKRKSVTTACRSLRIFQWCETGKWHKRNQNVLFKHDYWW